VCFGDFQSDAASAETGEFVHKGFHGFLTEQDAQRYIEQYHNGVIVPVEVEPKHIIAVGRLWFNDKSRAFGNFTTIVAKRMYIAYSEWRKHTNKVRTSI